jgi:two-component system, cell cycle sensor histidine kinase and response regulator CckA
MSMSLDSLRQRLASGESPDRELLELDGAIDSAFHIGRELVALGKPSVPAPSVVDINDLVAQLEGVLARVLGPNIQTTLQLGAVDSLVEAEAVQLEWVFLNLAANSREAMPNGGRFTVLTTSINRQVGTSPRLRRFVHLTVTDTGHGLFGDARIRAFDPFFSTKDGATGFGLTSVAMIVRSFQGWLHIESSERGTSIHIHLPALMPHTR